MKPSKSKKPRFGALVKFKIELLSKPGSKDYNSAHQKEYRKTFWDSKHNRPKDFIYFGEIPNQPGHCLLFEAATGKPTFFWHTNYFVELTDDET